MKRNILLLTAVVLAAVLMTGCIPSINFTHYKLSVKVEPAEAATVAGIAKNYVKDTYAEFTVTVKDEFKDAELEILKGDKEFEDFVLKETDEEKGTFTLLVKMTENLELTFKFTVEEEEVLEP